MFFVRIDTTITRNVVGFECGTRASFDERHGGDPLWVFIDTDMIRSGVKPADFLQAPLNYIVNDKGVLKKKT